jgi:hypothetical protein
MVKEQGPNATLRSTSTSPPSGNWSLIVIELEPNDKVGQHNLVKQPNLDGVSQGFEDPWIRITAP